MTCSNCSTQNEDHALFCTKCGTKLADGTPAAQQQQPQSWPLTITRESQFTGSLVGMTVTLDGNNCGSLKPGETQTYTMPWQVVHVSLQIWSTAAVTCRLRLWQGAQITCGIKMGFLANKLAIKSVAGAEVLEMSS